MIITIIIACLLMMISFLVGYFIGVCIVKREIYKEHSILHGKDSEEFMRKMKENENEKI